MKILSNDQKNYIYNTLTDAKISNRLTVYDVCANSVFNSRNIYYAVCNGEASDDDAYIAAFIGAGVNPILFEEYLTNCNICLDVRFSVRNRLICEFVYSYNNRMSVEDLDYILIINNEVPISKRFLRNS